MKQFKKTLIFIMVAALVFTGFLRINSTAQAKSINTKLSGEELFTGLVFGQGDVAKQFPEIWTKDMLKKANSKDAKKDVKILVSAMKKVDPNYFTDLEKAVYNQDLVSVYNQLYKGEKVLNDAVENNKQSIVSPHDEVSTNCLTTTLAALATGVLVLVVTGAAAANTYYVYNYTKLYTKSSVAATDTLSLEQEKFTKELVEYAVGN
ncbi:sporulation delaying protein family toxin [Priestia megaterium]|uniref:sporulation delaying protein family toxin n=1 Tax=Priestia megaterium TaxID=1404 RepID=UPI0022B870E2|nr:sporulation delaying protein family toxin [Priestia megaterium]MCZ8497361.1 sporulation delaying protein family toxin [Priestia megaterium]